MTRWGPAPPRWLLWCSVVVVAVGVGLTVAGAVRIGTTVDETFHVVRLGNYLDHGWFLLDDDLDAGRPGAWVGDAYVYAPVATLGLHVLNVLVGAEPWGAVAVTPLAYAVRHLGIALLGVATVVAAAAMARLLSGSWRWAVVAAAVLVALPVWSGHAMFNVKDVPVAAGYTLTTLACMLLVPARQSGRRRRVAVVLLALGLVLAVGTRPGIWPGPVAACGCVALVAVVGRRRWSLLGELAVGLALAAGALVAVYPAVFLHPASWLMGSAQQSAGYEGSATWLYVPISVLFTVPLVLLLMGSIGVVLRLRTRLLDRGTGWGERDLQMVLVVLQALLLPLIAMVTAPALSGGLRHLLFAAPAVAVLMAAGIAEMLRSAGSVIAGRTLTALAAVGLVVPVVTQAQLFPLAYAYVNPLTDVFGLQGPADYWQASFRELADDLPDGRFVLCGAREDRSGQVQRRMFYGGQSPLVLGDDCATSGALSVLEPWLRDGSVGEGDAVGPDFVGLVVFGPTPPGCTEIARETRHRLFTTTVASLAVSCPLVLPRYAGTIELDGAGAGAEHLLGGWTGDGGDDAVTVTRRAHLGFALPSGARGIRVRVVGEADAGLDFAINNRPARVDRTDGGWLVRPRGRVPSVGDPDNVVLTVIAPAGEGRISSVAVEGGDR